MTARLTRVLGVATVLVWCLLILLLGLRAVAS